MQIYKKFLYQTTLNEVSHKNKHYMNLQYIVIYIREN